MSDARLEQLLSGRYLATLATRNADGSMHLAVVWFLHHEGTVLVATSGTTRKARNAARRPAGSLLIDTRGPTDLRGAASAGSMEILTGELARGLNEQVWKKYLTPQGVDAPELGGAIRTNDDVTIRFTPDRWKTWGTNADFDGAFESAGMTFPLDT